MLPIAQRSPLPTHRAGRGSRNSGVALRRGFVFLLANSSDERLIGCAAPPPRTGVRGCWFCRGAFHGLGMLSPGVMATWPPGCGDVGLTRVSPWVFVAEVLSDVGF